MVEKHCFLCYNKPIKKEIKKLMELRHYLFDIKANLEANGWEYDATVDDNVMDRKNGKVFTINEHIRAMIFALLSNRTPWKRIKSKISEIDAIFDNYDPMVIKGTNPEEYISKIRKIKCGNQSIKNQMYALTHNISVLERLGEQYGSVDAFLTSRESMEVVTLLSSQRFPETKLKQMGEALIWEYIRNVGIDGAKPDVHLRRFLGTARMGVNSQSEASVDEVYRQVEELARATGLSKAGVDTIIWTFCAQSDEKYGEVCTAHPKCYICPVNNRCNYGKVRKVDYTEEILNMIRDVTQALGKTMDLSEVKIIDRGNPHVAPNKLPDGKMAVYTFIYNDTFLKIGKVGAKSNARYTSQHYHPDSASSTLAKSILEDKTMQNLGLTKDNIGEWIKTNCRRIDIEIDCDLGIFTLDLIESILHYKYTPKYEGFTSQR